MIIEVWTREKYAKSEEASLLEKLSRAGLKAGGARLSRLYKIDAGFSNKDYKILAGELLADTITETCSLSGRKIKDRGYWRVEVWLKNSVTDVVGESVKESVHDVLGRAPAGVRFGHAYYLRCSSPEKLRLAVAKTLINEVVNVCGITRA